MENRTLVRGLIGVWMAVTATLPAAARMANDLTGSELVYQEIRVSRAVEKLLLTRMRVDDIELRGKVLDCASGLSVVVEPRGLAVYCTTRYLKNLIGPGISWTSELFVLKDRDIPKEDFRLVQDQGTTKLMMMARVREAERMNNTADAKSALERLVAPVALEAAASHVVDSFRAADQRHRATELLKAAGDAMKR